jgi:hypothetical protein
MLFVVIIIILTTIVLLLSLPIQHHIFSIAAKALLRCYSIAVSESF